MPKHSVLLRPDRCVGCTYCIRKCPAAAIRVRNRKAVILSERCIDCGRCIMVCPHNAMHSVGDYLDPMKEFKYTIALPEPALFGQFHRLNNINIVLGALLQMGFDDVFEVAVAAELLSDNARRFHDDKLPLPRITSACPTVIRLIQMRFPKLIPHIESVVLPMELAAQLAREEAVKKTGLKPEEIGIFAIVPCSAKVTVSHSPMTLNAPVIDGTFSINSIYPELLSAMKDVADAPPDISRTGALGLSWGYCGGESAARLERDYVAVDGTNNIIRILDEIEDGRLPNAKFLELNACPQGCVGGCLTVENPYVCKMHLNHLADTLPKKRNTIPFSPAAQRLARFQKALEPITAFQMDTDRGVAMEKLLKVEKLLAELPGLDCASCGAPNCRSLAEDIVQGRASMDDCIFQVRAKIEQLASSESSNDNLLPAPFRHAIKRFAEK